MPSTEVNKCQQSKNLSVSLAESALTRAPLPPSPSVTSPSSTPTSAPSAAHASTSAPLAPSSDPTSGHGLVASHARNTFLLLFLTVPFVSQSCIVHSIIDWEELCGL